MIARLRSAARAFAAHYARTYPIFQNLKQHFFRLCNSYVTEAERHSAEWRDVGLCGQRALNNRQRLAELRIGDGERIEEADDVAVNAAGQQQQPFSQRASLYSLG